MGIERGRLRRGRGADGAGAVAVRFTPRRTPAVVVDCGQGGEGLEAVLTEQVSDGSFALGDVTEESTHVGFSFRRQWRRGSGTRVRHWHTPQSSGGPGCSLAFDPPDRRGQRQHESQDDADQRPEGVGGDVTLVRHPPGDGPLQPLDARCHGE